MPVITLLTDFGLQDTFVGVMKGVILSRCPNITLVDLTHTVPPQDVAAGAFHLADAFAHFPPGTVHLAVVDPGVGSTRAAVAVAVEDAFLVGPDNGLFSLVLARHHVRGCVQLTNTAFHRHPVSSTFHGRDIFAPAAAALAGGTPLHALGRAHVPQETLPWPPPVVRPSRVEGQVVHVDVFGNLLTSLDNHALDGWLGGKAPHLSCGTLSWDGIHTTFSDVAAGQPVAYAGSSGFVELAVNRGNAAQLAGVAKGAPVILTWA